MRVHSLFLLVCFLFVVSFCSADDPTVDIVGAAQCADCQQNNFKTSQAFPGLHVTIDCKLKTGEIKRVGDTELEEGGEFKISLVKEIIQDLKKECYAQLHNAAASPCPAHDTTKILIKSQTHDKIVFTPAKPLRFSTALCTSKFLWPFFQYPPLPKMDPWKKKWPKFTIPPLENYGQPWMLPPSDKLKPLPPPLPIYKPPTKPLPPLYKPLPPIYKPPMVKPLPPIYKPEPKPLVKPLPPIYKPLPKPPVVKPLPPIYKPPIYKPIPKPLPPPLPIYNKPPVVITKPLPPPFPLPPFYKKKPCPPFTNIPPKFEHPKFGYFPKPPFYSNP